MQRFRLGAATVGLLLTLGFPATSLALVVSLVPGGAPRITSIARQGPPSGVIDQDYITTIPLTGAAVAAQGDSNSTIGYVLSINGFILDVDQQVAQTALSNALLTEGSFVDFLVDEVATYAVGGSYVTTSETGQQILLQARLTDLTNGVTLYESRQASVSASDQTFVLGQQQGDLDNDLSGSANGVLVPGVVYQFSFGAGLSNPLAATAQITAATGSITLDFNPPAPVPLFHPIVEYTIVPLLLVGLGLVTMRNREA